MEYKINKLIWTKKTLCVLKIRLSFKYDRWRSDSRVLRQDWILVQCTGFGSAESPQLDLSYLMTDSSANWRRESKISRWPYFIHGFRLFEKIIMNVRYMSYTETFQIIFFSTHKYRNCGTRFCLLWYSESVHIEIETYSVLF